MTKKFYFFTLIFFIVLSFSSSCQIIEITKSVEPNKRIIKNKINKMILYGINKEKLINSKLNFYYYATGVGATKTNVYLDNNDIDLFYNNKANPLIIFDQKQKRKFTGTKKCYYSLKFIDSINYAKVECLNIEQKMLLHKPDYILIKNKISGKGTLQILLYLNPVAYLLRDYELYNRENINQNKYYIHIETFFPKTFIQLYEILNEKIITKSLNDKIINLYTNQMNNEIKKIPLLKPKGEFETTSDYKNRLQRGLKQKLIIENKYQQQISEFKEISDKRLSEKIKGSLCEDSLRIQNIGKYDADRQIFPITINNITKEINIPIKDAKFFKENFKNIRVLAKKQLNSDGENYHYFDIRIINPISNDTLFFNNN